MFPFNIIEWVKLVLLAGVMSVAVGTVFIGVRWRYWEYDPQGRNERFEQANIGGTEATYILLHKSKQSINLESTFPVLTK